MRSRPTGQWSATAAEVVRRIAAHRRFTEALKPALEFDNVRGPLKNYQRTTLQVALNNAIEITEQRRRGDGDIAFQLDAVKRHLLGAIPADRLHQVTTAGEDAPTISELHQSIAAMTAAALASIEMFTVEERAIVADNVATVLHAIDSPEVAGARAWLSAVLNFRLPGQPHLRADYVRTWQDFR